MASLLLVFLLLSPSLGSAPSTTPPAPQGPRSGRPLRPRPPRPPHPPPPTSRQPPPARPPHEDGRCRCVCPTPTSALQLAVNASSPPDGGGPERQVYVQSVLPSECNCANVVLGKLLQDPKIAREIGVTQLKEKFCPRCTCKYETRNTTVIKVVVIFILCVIGFLILYMGFLLCLYPWQRKGARTLYHEQRNVEVSRRDADHSSASLEDADDSGEPGVDPNVMVMRANPGSVLHRVGHQQSKWQKTVREQRRHIYDRHSMLN